MSKNSFSEKNKIDFNGKEIELENLSGSNRFGFLAEHRGMFSRLGASAQQVSALRENHAVYMVGDSRLNIAGLNSKTVSILAKAIVDCGI